MPTERTVTSSTYAITASNRMKLKSASHEFFCNKDYRRLDEVYLLDGRTDRGRWLRLVFQDKGNGVVRVFSGWDLIPQKNR